MAAEASQARDRMVLGAADMIRRRGLNATSVRELAKHSQAPLGSTYHYFPGGKTQLATEAVDLAANLAAGMLTNALAEGPIEGLRAFVSMWRKIVMDSDFQAGCPVLAVAVEEPLDDDAPQRAAARAFARWEALLADSLRSEGATPHDAEQTATIIVAAVEGTVAICRAERSTRSLDQVAERLEMLVRLATRSRS